MSYEDHWMDADRLKFAIGEEVSVVDHPHLRSDLRFTVEDFDDLGKYLIQPRGTQIAFWVRAEQMTRNQMASTPIVDDLITPQGPPIKFKVGDKVLMVSGIKWNIGKTGEIVKAPKVAPGGQWLYGVKIDGKPFVAGVLEKRMELAPTMSPAARIAAHRAAAGGKSPLQDLPWKDANSTNIMTTHVLAKGRLLDTYVPTKRLYVPPTDAPTLWDLALKQEKE